MKKMKQWAVTALDALWLFRTRRMFLTAGEARALVAQCDAATQCAQAKEREVLIAMALVSQRMARLQRVQLERCHNLTEVKLTLNTRSLAEVDEDTAIQVVSELVVARVSEAIRRVRDRSRPRAEKNETNERKERQ